MNEPPATPPRRPRPAQGENPAPRRRRQAPPRTLQDSSKQVGYAVLGVGVLAVLFVGWLLLSRFGGDAGNAAQMGGNEAQQTWAQENSQQPRASRPEAASILQELGFTRNPAAQRPASKNTPPKLAFKRQGKIAPARINGAWQTMVGDYMTVAHLEDGVYQIILAPSDPQAARIYSSGTYKIVEDVLTFTPQLSWPAPTPGNSRIPVTYNMLTRASFSLLVGFQSGRMLWQNAPEEIDWVYTTPRSPLFMAEPINFVAWQKVER